MVVFGEKELSCWERRWRERADVFIVGASGRIVAIRRAVGVV